MFDKILGFLNKFLALPTPRERHPLWQDPLHHHPGADPDDHHPGRCDPDRRNDPLPAPVRDDLPDPDPVRASSSRVLRQRIALYLDDHDSYAAVNTMISMPLFFTSSALMPYSVMPPWLRAIAIGQPAQFCHRCDPVRGIRHSAHSPGGHPCRIVHRDPCDLHAGVPEDDRMIRDHPKPV